MSSDTTTAVSVTVTNGWAVFHDGQQHSGGSVLTVDTDTAEEWTGHGWDAPTPPSKPSS